MKLTEEFITSAKVLKKVAEIVEADASVDVVDALRCVVGQDLWDRMIDDVYTKL
jgi:hypothetical protein